MAYWGSSQEFAERKIVFWEPRQLPQPKIHLLQGIQVHDRPNNRCLLNECKILLHSYDIYLQYRKRLDEILSIVNSIVYLKLQINDPLTSGVFIVVRIKSSYHVPLPNPYSPTINALPYEAATLASFPCENADPP